VLGSRYGFRAEKIDPVRYKEFVVSSTRVRRLVSEGRVDEAGALLGHAYSLDGSVVRGDQRGRTIGFPTANLCTENELLPPHGVYATTARIRDVVHASVTNIGVRPTVDQSGRTTIETHIFQLRSRHLWRAGSPRLRTAHPRRAGLRDAGAAAGADRGRLCRARVLFDRLSL
jgi:riboflavin kinase/FMN adenylyltransferase